MDVTPRPLRVALNARVSSREKDQGPGLQLQPLREYAARGWQPAEYVDRAAAAGLARRRDWARLLDDVRRRCVDHVLAWKLDRLCGGNSPVRQRIDLCGWQAPAVVDLLMLLLALLRVAVRSRTELVAENFLLRHQLAVLTRPTRRRPRLRTCDKLLWVFARRCWRSWRRHLVLVRPETVVRWHR